METCLPTGYHIYGIFHVSLKLGKLSSGYEGYLSVTASFICSDQLDLLKRGEMAPPLDAPHVWESSWDWPGTQ